MPLNRPPWVPVGTARAGVPVGGRGSRGAGVGDGGRPSLRPAERPGPNEDG